MRKPLVVSSLVVAVAVVAGARWLYANAWRREVELVARYQVVSTGSGSPGALLVDTASGEIWRLCHQRPDEAESWGWCYQGGDGPRMARAAYQVRSERVGREALQRATAGAGVSQPSRGP